MKLEIAPESVAEGRLLAERTLPEWHYRRRSLMPDYCAVQVITPKTKDPDWCPDADMRRRIHRVRRQFEALRSEEHTSELQSRGHLVCRLLLAKKKIISD